MSDPNDFAWMAKGDKTAGDQPEACRHWAVRLSDAADGLLSDTEQTEVDHHVLTCKGCAWELADAQRGAAWLGLLKGHTPEPPANLLSAILEKTSGADALLAKVGAASHDAVATSHAWWGVATPVNDRAETPGTWGRLGRWLGIEGGFATILQPRLAMTSAMAFLSICLTLNLLGVSVRSLNAESLRPAELQRTVADTGASLVRSFEGIRMVYRVESRVVEWRTATATQADSPLGSAH